MASPAIREPPLYRGSSVPERSRDDFLTQLNLPPPPAPPKPTSPDDLALGLPPPPPAPDKKDSRRSLPRAFSAHTTTSHGTFSERSEPHISDESSESSDYDQEIEIVSRAEEAETPQPTKASFFSSLFCCAAGARPRDKLRVKVEPPSGSLASKGQGTAKMAFVEAKTSTSNLAPREVQSDPLQMNYQATSELPTFGRRALTDPTDNPTPRCSRVSLSRARLSKNLNFEDDQMMQVAALPPAQPPLNTRTSSGLLMPSAPNLPLPPNAPEGLGVPKLNHLIHSAPCQKIDPPELPDLPPLSTWGVPSKPTTKRKSQDQMLAPRKKPLLILDMDETLLHSSPSGKEAYDIKVLAGENEEHEVFVKIRPYCKEFLQACSKFCVLYVFTAGNQDYADPVLNAVDKDGLIKKRYYNPDCTKYNGNHYEKDITKCTRDLRTAILVDNSVDSWRVCPKNAIRVSSWFGNPHDTQLLELIPVLETIFLHYKDVREVLNANVRSWKSLKDKAKRINPKIWSKYQHLRKDPSKSSLLT